jgi:aryl carrier-like protein
VVSVLQPSTVQDVKPKAAFLKMGVDSVIVVIFQRRLNELAKAQVSSTLM